MCGIAGCYQQPDGQKLTDIMIDRIAHRGPDATPDLRLRGRPGLGAARPPAAVDHRPVRSRRSAAQQGRADPHLQRRAVQLPRPCGPISLPAASASAPVRTPRSCSRPGGCGARTRCRSSAACSRSRCSTSAPASWSWPATRSASSRCTTCRRGGGVVFASELKALVAAARRGAADRARRAGRLDALLLAARAAVRDRRRAQAARRKLGRAAAGRQLPGRVVLARSPEVAAEAAAGPPADLRQVIEESVTAHLVADVPVSSFLSGGLDSSIVTVLANRPSRGSRRTRSPSGPRTSGSRRCPTTRSTPARSPRSTASSCTRSRSPRTSSICCPAWSTCSTSRSATRRRSTRC